MTTKDDNPETRRQERLDREREDAARARRRRRLTQLGAVAAAAAVLVVAAILISSSGGDGDEPATRAPDASGVAGAAETAKLLDGIPQSGNTLGKPDAPVTMVEYVDLQCPFCRDYTLEVMPTVIDRYVRPGKLRVELRLLRFLGADSDRAARAAVVAGRENRMWNFVDLFFHNQGEENSGFADEAFIRRLGSAVPGIDPAALISEASDAEVERTLVGYERAAQEGKVEATPWFTLRRGDGKEERLEVNDLTPEAFTGPLDEATGGAG